MAVTLSQQPQNYTPASNQQTWVGLSNQIAQPNFSYTVKVTDLITSEFQIYSISPDPNTDECLFDSRPFVEHYIEHYIPENLYGWQQSREGVRQIRVNIGETYGATPAYTAGSDVNYIVWNGVLNHEDFPTYDPLDYVYDCTNMNLVYLSSPLTTKKFYEDKSHYFYALTSGAGDILNIQVITYDSAGTQLGDYYIDNPYESNLNYRDKYLCIDIGYKGLDQISSGDVTVNTGTFPIITPSVASYEVYENNISTTPAQGNSTLIGFFTEGCDPRYEEFVIHYLRKTGAFETIVFNKRSDQELRTNKTTYKKNPNVLSSGTYAYSASTAVERVLNSTTARRLKLQTDWLSPYEVDVHQDLLDSPFIYLDRGSSLSFLPITCAEGSYKLNVNTNQKLFNLQMDFEYAFENYRQRG